MCARYESGRIGLGPRRGQHDFRKPVRDTESSKKVLYLDGHELSERTVIVQKEINWLSAFMAKWIVFFAILVSSFSIESILIWSKKEL